MSSRNQFFFQSGRVVCECTDGICGVSKLKNHWWKANFLTSRHVRMHRVIFYISNTLRKLMIGALGLKCLS